MMTDLMDIIIIILDLADLPKNANENASLFRGHELRRYVRWEKRGRSWRKNNVDTVSYFCLPFCDK